jgi:hypothetical protein
MADFLGCSSVAGRSAPDVMTSTSYLHVHDVAVRLNDLVTHLQGCLERDARLLPGDHGFLETHRRVVQGEFLAEPPSFFLQSAGRLQGVRQCILESFALSVPGLHERSIGSNPAGSFSAPQRHLNRFVSGSGGFTPAVLRLPVPAYLNTGQHQGRK